MVGCNNLTILYSDFPRHVNGELNIKFLKEQAKIKN
jgi:hypothetical protein